MRVTKIKSKEHWGNGVMCQCNHPNPLVCHECEESTGVCLCECHEGFKHEFATPDAPLENNDVSGDFYN